MVATYSYEKDVDIHRLSQEIRDSAAITIVLDSIYSAVGNVDIHFKAGLSELEKLVLDKLMLEHANIPLVDHSASVVKIQEEEENHKTGGHFQVTTLDIDVPEGEQGEVTKHSFSFPFPIAILEGELLISEEIVGDCINICVAPGTVVGILTRPVVPGNTAIYVSNTVLANAWVGVYLQLTNGTSRLEDLGRVLEVHDDYVLMENPAQQDHSPADPIYVQEQTMRELGVRGLDFGD